MSLFRNQLSEEEQQGIELIKNACPICRSNVKGSAQYHYFCKKCNILFRKEDLLLSPEHIESIIKNKIADKLQKDPIIIPKSDDALIPLKTPKVVIEKKVYYFASRESNKVHASNCPYAKNIKKENRIRFASLDDANAYIKCRCVV